MTTATVAPTIPGLTEPAIAAYFERINAGDYSAASRLFAADGRLYPPFEEPAIGPEAIAQYLAREAKGMKFFPGAARANGDGIRVLGRVQAPYFSLNVAWQFAIAPHGKLASTQIELLASPEELLSLSR